MLGESHYCGDACADCGSLGHPECADFTRKVVADYLNPANEREGWMNTYLKFERSLVGHETTPDESQRIWDDIAFYNYLLQEGGRVRAFCVCHPSAGYDWSYWHKVIKKVAVDGLVAR